MYGYACLSCRVISFIFVCACSCCAHVRVPAFYSNEVLTFMSYVGIVDSYNNGMLKYILSVCSCTYCVQVLLSVMDN
jgi:hypothetical protein